MLTMETAGAVTAVLGDVPLCYGCSGLTAHYCLDARSGGAPLMLGAIFLLLGLLGGSASMQIFGLIPFFVLGVLLAYVGFQHLLLARDLRGWQAWLTALWLTRRKTSNVHCPLRTRHHLPAHLSHRPL